jgi:hypothetical protein
VITGPQPAAAPQRGRDDQVRLGRHGDHPGRVAARDNHARGGGEGQPVPGPPAQHAGHGPVGDPPGSVHPASPVHHVTGDRRDLRRGSHRQAARRGRPAVLPCARPGPRRDEGRDKRGGHGRLPGREGPERPGEPGRVFKQCLACGKFPRSACPRGDLNTHFGAISPDRGNHAIGVTRPGRTYPGIPRSVRYLVRYLACAWLGAAGVRHLLRQAD